MNHLQNHLLKIKLPWAVKKSLIKMERAKHYRLLSMMPKEYLRVRQDEKDGN